MPILADRKVDVVSRFILRTYTEILSGALRREPKQENYKNCGSAHGYGP